MTTLSVRPPCAETEVNLCVGQFYAARQATLIKTLLGSCIAVCLWDPESTVGGMNHFMLPGGERLAGDDAARFGIHAMDLLIGAIMKAGGDRRRFRAKVFGGGHVLKIEEAPNSVPRQNIRFIREFCRDEGFPIVSEDVGGYDARHVHFQTHTGRAWVKRLRSMRSRAITPGIERQIVVPAVAPPAYGEVTLF
jgi:chemotaxis receptor (MCP) glutamine deamidase CheD